MADLDAIVENLTKLQEEIVESITELQEEVLELKQSLLDLTTAFDDLPVLNNVYEAVRELQQRIDAPASELIYYLR